MKVFFYIFLACAPTVVFSETLNCPCQVVEVLQGDTVFVLDQYKSTRKIWLAGIYAPQMNQDFGVQSKQNLIKLVSDKNIHVEYIQRDRYGRIVGKLLIQDMDINLQQIKDGYAWHYKKNPDEQSDADHALYSNAEKEAKKTKTGLWSDYSAIPPWEFRQGK